MKNNPKAINLTIDDTIQKQSDDMRSENEKNFERIKAMFPEMFTNKPDPK